jgi:hypothetical protein
MSLSRPTASNITRKLSCTAALCLGLLGFSVAPALAHEAKVPPVKLAPAEVSAELAVCPGQTFSQPFEALKDSNYYTLVEGGEFKSAEEGWTLTNGAQIVQGTGPEGTSSLDLPSGAEAVSPSVCVTLLYPTARMYVQNVEGGGGVAVSVAYTGTKTEEKPQNVGQIHGQHGEWTLSNPFNVQPQIAGHNEETRQVRFYFTAGGKNNDYRLHGLYVDPRMR